MALLDKFSSIRRRINAALSEYGEDLFAQIAGALWRFVFVGVKEAINLYFLIAFRFILWSLIPLAVLFGLLLSLSQFGPGAMGLAGFLALVVGWQVVLFLVNLLPDERPKESDTEVPTGNNTGQANANSKTSVADGYGASKRFREQNRVMRFWSRVLGSFSRIGVLIRELVTGSVKKNRFFGFVIRAFGMSVGVVFAIRTDIGLNLEVINNPIMAWVSDLFIVSVRQPFEFLVENAQLLVEVLNDYGIEMPFPNTDVPNPF